MRAVFLLFITLFLSCTNLNAEERIVYTAFKGRYWQIADMKSDGTNTQYLTDSAGDKRLPVFYDNRRQLLYETAEGKLFHKNLLTGKTKQIFNSIPYMNGVAVSIDIQQIAFTSFRTDTRDLSDIFTAHLNNTSTITRVTNKIGVVRSPRWNKKDTKLLFTVYTPGKYESIYEVDLISKGVNNIIENSCNNIYPSYSPNNTKIAYASDMAGNYDIWIFDQMTGKQSQCTVFPGLDTTPVWTEDGEFIVYVTTQTGTMQIAMISENTAEQKILTQGTNPCKDPFVYTYNE